MNAHQFINGGLCTKCGKDPSEGESGCACVSAQEQGELIKANAEMIKANSEMIKADSLKMIGKFAI